MVFETYLVLNVAMAQLKGSFCLHKPPFDLHYVDI